MGAIVNGLGLQGFRAFGGTFLNFSDYMRGAVRLAALMKLPAIYVWTHDSIGLGEDGPTHQPVEHLAALRAMPRLNVVRPADANETALGVALRAARDRGPDGARAVAPGRADARPGHASPTTRSSAAPTCCATRATASPDVILIGDRLRGVAVHRGGRRARGRRLDVRVVSMPCMDTFDEQDEAYRDSVLPPSVRARVAVEAASPFGWHQWIGPDGAFVGMTTFGESGPAPDVYEHFGITAERVAELAREALDRVGRQERVR